MCCSSTPREAWIRCLIILALVLVLSTPVSVSLPYLPTSDMAHVRFNTTVKLRKGLGNTDIQGLRVRSSFAITSPCHHYSLVFGRLVSTTLPMPSHACKPVVDTPSTYLRMRNQTITATIPSSYTTALIIHPVATAVVLIVFLSGMTTNRKIMLTFGYLALLLSWAAFWIDVGLLVYLGFQVGGLRFGGSVVGGTGMWMTLSTSILFVFSECAPRPPLLGRRSFRYEGSRWIHLPRVYRRYSVST